MQADGKSGRKTNTIERAERGRKQEMADRGTVRGANVTECKFLY